MSTLRRQICAVEIWQAPEGTARMGMIVSIPESAEIERCGAGFNDSTVRICWNGNQYLAFLKDLEGKAPRKDEIETVSAWG